MKRRTFIYVTFLLFFGLVFASPVFAQSEGEDTSVSLEETIVESPEEREDEARDAEEQKTRLKAVAGEDQSVAVLRKVVFDASKSVNSSDDLEMTYSWDLGDGTKKEGIDIIHEYDKSGFYRVVLTIDNGEEQDTEEVIVSVYEDLMVVIVDGESDQERLKALKRYAARQGVLLVSIGDTTSSAEYVVEDSLVKSLLESSQDVKKADIIISLTSSPSLGLGVLSKFGKQAESIDDLDISHKGVVVISEKSLAPIARIAQSTYEVLKPEYIVLTKSSALEAIVDARKSEEVVEGISSVGVEHVQIGVHSERAVKELGVTNFLSYTVYQLVNEGIETETITLILLLPIVATLIAFARQMLGIKTFGIYVPSLISLTLVATGIKYGLFIFLVLLVSATVVRLLLKKIRILYLPRMALVLTATAFVILALFFVGAATNRTGIIALSVFPILILIILVEKFIEAQIEKGFSHALRLSLETLLVSVATYYIISWESLKTFIIAYPEVILLTIPINILVGKWVGLRISEYFRFKELSRFIGEKDKK